MNRVLFSKTRVNCLRTVSRRGVRSRAKATLHEKSVEGPDDGDFFGIKLMTNKEVAGEYLLKEKNKPMGKYGVLMKPRDVLHNEEKLVTASFGKIRYDSRHAPRYHGQYDPDNTRLAFDVNQSVEEFNPFQEHSAEESTTPPIGSQDEDASGLESQFISSKAAPTGSGSKDTLTDLNYVDQQFFGAVPGAAVKPVSESNEPDSSLNQPLPPKNADEEQLEIFSNLKSETEKLNFIDAQYFRKSGANRLSTKTNEPPVLGKYNFNFTEDWYQKMDDDVKENQEIIDQDLENYKRRREEAIDRMEKDGVYEGLVLGATSPLKSVAEIEDELREIREEQEEQTMEVPDEEEVDLQEEEEMIEEKPEGKEEQKRPFQLRTAYDYLNHLRKGNIDPVTENFKKARETGFKVAGEDLYTKIDGGGKRLDSQGFRYMKDETLDLRNLRRTELLHFLKKNILFKDNDIVAINKPYGLVVQGSDGTAAGDPVLFDLLPDFAELICKGENLKEKPKLYPCHRLDKETTGVLVMATTQQMARTVQSMFANHKIEKYYYAITKSVPAPLEGMIDIPMEEGSIDGKKRMVLRPELEEELRRLAKPSKQAKRAITYYRVRSHEGNAALVEIQPETGVKHQIRCHLGFALRTPILGDHKYSHLDRLAPQKLPADMLVKLGVRQPKVRNIPIHLHARLMIIPELGRNGGNLFIQAHTPHHFRDSMTRLKLSGRFMK